MTKENTERRSDALWSDKEAYSFIDDLFKNEAFLSVAQERVQNHGTPVCLSKYEKNFDSIMERWASSPPKLTNLG